MSTRSRLAFEGESGPYLQYAVVRAQNIFAKLREREGLDEEMVFARLTSLPAGELAGESTPRGLSPGHAAVRVVVSPELVR